MVQELDNEAYTIDRKTASRLLKISIRTVDRYVKSKKLSTTVVDGRVWLSRRQIEGIRDGSKVDMSTPHLSTDNRVDNVDTVEVIDHEDVNTLSTSPRKAKRSNNVYKKLFDDLKEELHEKQERLEIANYRVGQLEAQVRNSVPMLEYHKEQYEIKQREKDLMEKLNLQNKVLIKTKTKERHEKFNKRMFLGILLITLALQPLWLLLIYK